MFFQESGSWNSSLHKASHFIESKKNMFADSMKRAQAGNARSAQRPYMYENLNILSFTIIYNLFIYYLMVSNFLITIRSDGRASGCCTAT